MGKRIVSIVAVIGGLALVLMTVVVLCDPQIGQGAVHATMLAGVAMSIITALLAFGRADDAATHAQRANEQLTEHLQNGPDMSKPRSGTNV